jgi:hypothetical protein
MGDRSDRILNADGEILESRTLRKEDIKGGTGIETAIRRKGL